MYERTITIGSAGKTFSVTGWKIGWAYGPANLIYNLQVVHQNSVYTCPTPIQVNNKKKQIFKFINFTLANKLMNFVLIVGSGSYRI